jgi:hypothetical protein
LLVEGGSGRDTSEQLIDGGAECLRRQALQKWDTTLRE